MRFMLLMIPKGYESAAPGTMPDPEAVEKMMRFLDELQQAGVLVEAAGLHPPSSGARVTYSSGAAEVEMGPFPGVDETIGGYWILELESLDEAIAWAKKCPAADNETVEVRRFQAPEAFE